MTAHAIHGATTPAPKSAADQQKVAGKQLEAFFLRRLLAEARPAGDGGSLDGGFAGDTFKGMLDEAIADKMSDAGGIGLAKVFAKQLGGAETAAGAGASATQALDPHALAPHIAVRPLAPATLHPAMQPTGALTQLPAGPELPGMPHLVMPVAGTPTSGYGARVDPIKHATITHPGFDLAAKTGTPVAPAAPGEVVTAGPAGTYGNLVVVRHADGFETRYAHLSAVTVKPGDQVAAGQQVGNVGTTGYSTGPHLHFEVRHDGKPMDPAPLLPLYTAGGRPNR